jgi:hypothetical protein
VQFPVPHVGAESYVGRLSHRAIRTQTARIINSQWRAVCGC